MTARRKRWSDEEKAKARERDRERKRRDQLTPSQLAQVRFLDKENKKRRRKKKNMIKNDKLLHFHEIKEIKRIKTLLRVREQRSKLSEEEKQGVRDRARDIMSRGRKEGFLRKYKQRRKRDKNHLVIWKNYFKSVNLDLFMMDHPNMKNTHEELKVWSKQVKEMENKKREEAFRNSRMQTWNPRTAFKKREEASFDYDDDDEDDGDYSFHDSDSAMHKNIDFCDD